MPEIISKEVNREKVIDFSTAENISIKDLTDIEKNKIQNSFLHILVEKGAILEQGVKTSEVREVIIDQIYCFEDEKKLDEFLEYIKSYNA